jgi:phosphatidylinositol glycan class P protein
MASIECMVDEAGKVAILNSDGIIIREKGKSRFAAARGGRGGGKGKGAPKKQRSRQNSLEDKKRPYAPADLGRDVPWRELWNEGTDAVMDVPIGGVCEILYGEGRQLDSDLNEHYDEL